MNIVMILSDSFRYDNLGCYGYHDIETPNLDKFAESAVIFENTYPDGLPTMPVRTSLFTGNYSLTNRFWDRLMPTDVSMPEILDEYGFVNAMITDTYHFFKPNMNFHRGFHHWDWIRGQESDSWITKKHKRDWNKYAKEAMKDTMFIKCLDQHFRNTAHYKTEADWSTAQVFTKAANWLEDMRDDGRPLFLYVDCFDPHEPWEAPPQYIEKYVDPAYKGPWIIQPKMGERDWLTDEELAQTRNLYAAEVTFVDRWIGHLLDKMEELEMMDDTLILFMSDHGHPLADHGVLLKRVDQLYAELVRLPLLVRFPKGENGGKRIKPLINVVDIMPTIMEFIGSTVENEYVQGKSILPLIRGEVDKLHDHSVIGFFNTDDRNIRTEEWSFIRKTELPDELYYLPDDPKELNNVIDQYPEKAKELDETMARIFKIRLQKEHTWQLHYDIPGWSTGVYPPLRHWKK